MHEANEGWTDLLGSIAPYGPRMPSCSRRSRTRPVAGAVAPSCDRRCARRRSCRTAGTRESLRRGRTRECGGVVQSGAAEDFRFPFPHAVENAGSGTGSQWRLTVIDVEICSSPNEAVAAVAGFDDAAGCGQRRKPFIESSGTDTAFGAQLPEGKRRSSIGKS